ncbi:MAG: YIP1 family protein [Pseudomonadota bacterium]
MNNFQLAMALVLDPKAAIREIEARPRFVFPLLITIFVTVAASVWYFNIVDSDWLIDATIRSSPRGKNVSDEQMAQLTKIMSRNTLMISTLIGVPFIAVIMRLLEATWYLLAGKVTKVQRSFKQWFALATWSSLPGVLALLPAIPLLLTAKDPQIDSGALSPLSLNELFFHRAMGASGYSLFTNINLIQIFTVFLVILAIRMWSGRSWLFAVVYTLLPAALIVGIWALVAFR